MRAYITVLDGDTDLVPFFVRHYSRLGATEFHVLIYGTQDHMDQTISLIEGEGAKATAIGVIGEEHFAARHRDVYIGHYHGRNGWAFFNDLDEFVDLTPEQVHKITRSGKWPYIKGLWLDRVSEDGSLQDITPGVPLDEQFPMCAKVRAHMNSGQLVYVAAPWGPYMHHPNVCQRGRARLHKAFQATVHHFKWQGNALRRLERRLERIEACGKGDSKWHQRVARMVKILKKHEGLPKNWLNPSKPLGI